MKSPNDSVVPTRHGGPIHAPKIGMAATYGTRLTVDAPHLNGRVDAF